MTDHNDDASDVDRDPLRNLFAPPDIVPRPPAKPLNLRVGDHVIYDSPGTPLLNSDGDLIGFTKPIRYDTAVNEDGLMVGWEVEEP